MAYQTTVQGWHTFYAISGEAAASLTGLLFVGLSLHLKLVVARPDVRALARVTFTGFVLMLLLALFLAEPQSNVATTGWQLIASGIAAGLLTIPSLISGARSGERTIDSRRLLLRFGLSTAVFAGVIATGCIFVGGSYQSALDVLVTVTVVILLVSLRNTWDLLVSTALAAPLSGDSD